MEMFLYWITVQVNGFNTPFAHKKRAPGINRNALFLVGGPLRRPSLTSPPLPSQTKKRPRSKLTGPQLGGVHALDGAPKHNTRITKTARLFFRRKCDYPVSPTPWTQHTRHGPIHAELAHHGLRPAYVALTEREAQRTAGRFVGGVGGAAAGHGCTSRVGIPHARRTSATWSKLRHTKTSQPTAANASRSSDCSRLTTPVGDLSSILNARPL